MMARWSDRLERPLRAFALLQVAIAVCGVLSLATFATLGAAETSSDYLYSTLWGPADVAAIPVHALLIVFPSTLAMGALFPLIARLCVGSPETTALVVGRIYGWNTVGAIAGSFLTGFVLIPAFGTRSSFILVAAVSLGLGCCGILLSHRRERALRLGPSVGVAVAVFVGACAVQIPASCWLRTRETE